MFIYIYIYIAMQCNALQCKAKQCNQTSLALEWQPQGDSICYTFHKETHKENGLGLTRGCLGRIFFIIRKEIHKENGLEVSRGCWRAFA